jgi:hypothetical protein
MGTQDLKEQLLEQGFIVVKDIIPKIIIDHINERVWELRPDRGHAVDNKYFARNKVHECPEFALWWSQQLHDWMEVQAVGRILLDHVGDLFNNPEVYVADIITNTPRNKYIKPHIDSPYRFDKWHERFDLLGVQCIVPLCEFTQENGGTGLLPGSHKTNWVVQDSYRGLYNEQFLQGVVQPAMGPGDALIYFPRVLHSTMPNNTDYDRRALLVHITSREMINQMKLVDNIWLG